MTTSESLFRHIWYTPWTTFHHLDCGGKCRSPLCRRCCCLDTRANGRRPGRFGSFIIIHPIPCIFSIGIIMNDFVLWSCAYFDIFRDDGIVLGRRHAGHGSFGRGRSDSSSFLLLNHQVFLLVIISTTITTVDTTVDVLND